MVPSRPAIVVALPWEEATAHDDPTQSQATAAQLTARQARWRNHSGGGHNFATYCKNDHPTSSPPKKPSEQDLHSSGCSDWLSPGKITHIRSSVGADAFRTEAVILIGCENVACMPALKHRYYGTRDQRNGGRNPQQRPSDTAPPRQQASARGRRKAPNARGMHHATGNSPLPPTYQAGQYGHHGPQLTYHHPTIAFSQHHQYCRSDPPTLALLGNSRCPLHLLTCWAFAGG